MILTRLFRRGYGASPLHLVAHLALFGVTVFALHEIFGGGDVAQLIAWYLGFVLLHDVVLVPVYSAVDLALQRVTGRHRRGAPAPPRTLAGVPIINHIRVPALIAAVLCLVFAPLIFALGSKTNAFYSGHPAQGYLRNWLLITAGLFLASALVWAGRAVRLRTRPADPA